MIRKLVDAVKSVGMNNRAYRRTRPRNGTMRSMAAIKDARKASARHLRRVRSTPEGRARLKSEIRHTMRYV